jgi:hypothetical protein
MNTRNASTLLLAAALLPACAAYKIEPPAGFAVVSEHGWETRMKAQDNVGLSVRRFENVKGGTLAFWGADLVKKLGTRGYVLKAQSAVKTGNGKTGTRFDFDYVTYDTEIPKFYSVVLVVTDKHKIVLQVAGGREVATQYTTRMPRAHRRPQGPWLQAGLEDLRRRAAAPAGHPHHHQARRGRRPRDHRDPHDHTRRRPRAEALIHRIRRCSAPRSWV